MTDPIERFVQLLERAKQTDLPEPTAMALATASPDGRPSVRMVLLKSVDASGFVFYTNLESRKGRDLAANPWAALCFHWQPLEVQVRVEGPVTPVTAEEADAYFASRARGSQIGAWASQQSRELSAYDALEKRVAEMQEEYADRPIARPDYWSGFRVRPERIEFWSNRPSRLHERDVFVRKKSGGWDLHYLYP